MTHAWIDASAGIAGDMLLGALLDAGAELAEVQQAVDAVVAESVRITVDTVTRAGMRGSKAEVVMTVEDPPHRTWASIQTMITEAGLAPRVRDRALAVFARLAEAEGRVHGIPAADVHFHEVGALDSIADVVGCCAALESLQVDTLSAGEVALGSGEIRAAHGTIPVPVPAVTQLSAGRRVTSGGRGERTTPTGMALLAALTTDEDLPTLVVAASGSGAGTKDFPGRANLTRVVLGERAAAPSATAPGSAAVLLEANVDDLDPRLWPGVLARLLDAGADDAWLVPMIMKKGRPAHVLSVLADPVRAADLQTVIFASTSTIGVRQTGYTKYALPRVWVDVPVDGEPMPVKIAHRDGVVVQATAEFGAVADRARRTGRSEQELLAATQAAAVAAGYLVGAPAPTGVGVRSVREVLRTP